MAVAVTGAARRRTATPLPSVTRGLPQDGRAPGADRSTWAGARAPGRPPPPLRSQHMVGGGAPPRPAETGCSRYRIRERQRRGARARAAARTAPALEAEVEGGGRERPGCPRRGSRWGAGAGRCGRAPGDTRPNQLAIGSGPRPKELNLSHVTERLIRRGGQASALLGAFWGLFSALLTW